jgi:ABC-type transport system involved in multi-copper enzyme maturation permease subunit
LKSVKAMSLPLLAKELYEQSSRTRTFVIRGVYALLLFAAIGFWNANALYQAAGSAISIGSQVGFGREVFWSIIVLQFIGVYLFLPALASGVLTVEKERDTLGLLLITKLSPWTIILEKFFSRILPMLAFLLISLPVISFTYSMGGMEMIVLVIGIWFLLLTVLQIASVAVLASSFFSSTVASFLGTYLLLAAVSGGLIAFDGLFCNGALGFAAGLAFQPYFNFLAASPSTPMGNASTLAFYSCFFPCGLFFINHQILATSTGFGGSTTGLIRPFLLATFVSLPLLFSVVVNLALARFFLVRRAFIASTNPVLSLFKTLDRIFVWANNRFTHGIVLVKESQHMPESDPVRWRETAKRSLGQFRYLVRVLVLLEFPTLIFIWFTWIMPSVTSAGSTFLSHWTFAVWIVSILLIAVTSSNLISGERSRQTLDVLLTTPMRSRELILQKLGGVRRLTAVCAVPLVSTILFQTYRRIPFYPNQPIPFADRRHGTNFSPEFEAFEYLLTYLATLVILLHLATWLSLWVGMRMKSSSKAILSTLSLLVAFCILPYVIVFVSLTAFNYPGPNESGLITCGFLFSPAILIMILEADSLRTLHPLPFFPLVCNSVIHGGLWYMIRHRVLANADAGLGRQEGPPIAVTAYGNKLRELNPIVVPDEEVNISPTPSGRGPGRGA